MGNTVSAYRQRNILAALLARLFPSGWRETDIEGWDAEWKKCVYIDLPTGQISFHYHDNEHGLFQFLPKYTKEYDGHDDQTKWGRVIDLMAKLDAEAIIKRGDAEEIIRVYMEIDK